MHDKNVLLYSGGLDSFCLHYILTKKGIEHDLLVVLTGTDDNYIEVERAFKYINEPINTTCILLDKFELQNKIVPLRNALFILAAANFGNKIYFGSTVDDVPKDGDYIFKSIMETLLNYYGSDRNGVSEDMGYPYEIIMPFKEYTKAMIIQEYLNYGGHIDGVLYTSYSCYKGSKKPCGICTHCLRKFVALLVNGIDVGINYYENDPKLKLLDFYREASHFHRKEAPDICGALDICKIEYELEDIVDVK